MLRLKLMLPVLIFPPEVLLLAVLSPVVVLMVTELVTDEELVLV